jgi:GGDEF domain-containing protein
MPATQSVLIAGPLPEGMAVTLDQWASSHGFDVHRTCLPLSRNALRASIPDMIVMGVEGNGDACRSAVSALKGDSRLQCVPVVAVLSESDAASWLDWGVDEVLSPGAPSGEHEARLTGAVRRTRRDVQVNPSTRLAGADALAEAMLARIASGDLFGACYADLDHFKEFNDRYGFAMGDDVIRAVAELLVEVVEAAAGDRGFVGHIGGDDFLFLVPYDCVPAACDLLVQRADEILPARYSAHDRNAGYFFGKDRRGRLDRVPLMTLSIGVVTNARRRFTSAAQISELATEMKTYAKTLPGSVWAMDRRSDGESAIPPEEKCQ